VNARGIQLRVQPQDAPLLLLEERNLVAVVVDFARPRVAIEEFLDVASARSASMIRGTSLIFTWV